MRWRCWRAFRQPTSRRSLDNHSLLGGVSFALLAFGTLLFTVVMSFLLLNMTKERTELQHKINSLVDPLSGVANRRAFLNGSHQLFEQQASDREPLAMLLFDLDRFKDINDRLGHAVGDRVLQTFAQSATTTLGAEVLFGRIGGEEFACLMPVGDLGEAFAVADRVRRNFADVAARFAERRVHARPSASASRSDSDPKIEHRCPAGDRRPRALPRQGQRTQPRRGGRARSMSRAKSLAPARRRSCR